MCSTMRWFILSGIHSMCLSPSPVLAVCSGKRNGRRKWYFSLKKGSFFADISSFNVVQQSEVQSSETTGYARSVNDEATNWYFLMNRLQMRSRHIANMDRHQSAPLPTSTDPLSALNTGQSSLPMRPMVSLLGRLSRAHSIPNCLIILWEIRFCRNAILSQVPSPLSSWTMH